MCVQVCSCTCPCVNLCEHMCAHVHVFTCMHVCALVITRVCVCGLNQRALLLPGLVPGSSSHGIEGNLDRTTEEGVQTPSEALLTQTVAFGAKTPRRKGRNINKATCHPVADSDTVHLFVLKRGADCLANAAGSHYSSVTLRASALGPGISGPCKGRRRGWGPGGGTTGKGPARQRLSGRPHSAH